MFDDVAGVEFEGIAVWTQNPRGIERVRPASASVGDKVQVRKALRRTCQEFAGSSLGPGQNRASRLWKVVLDLGHFRLRLAQNRKLRGGLRSIADQQQITCTKHTSRFAVV